MAFIDTSDTLIGVEIAQNDARYIRPGQDAEVTFKFMPGRSTAAKVESILQAVATGQVQAVRAGRYTERRSVASVRRADQAG